MPYDPNLIQPMRDELVELGVDELRTAEDADAFLSEKAGTALLIVNSVCGCAAGMARPAVRMALENGVRPDRCVTVFAGQDTEATARVRAASSKYPPSSPSYTIFKAGLAVHHIPRHEIEGRDAATVAGALTAALSKHCAAPTG